MAFLLPYLENSYSSIETHFNCCLLCEVLGLPRWLSTKESACNARDTGDVGSIPRWGRSPRGGNGNSLAVFLLGKSRRQRSLMGYSPWDPVKSWHDWATEHCEILLCPNSSSFKQCWQAPFLYNRIVLNNTLPLIFYEFLQVIYSLHPQDLSLGQQVNCGDYLPRKTVRLGRNSVWVLWGMSHELRRQCFAKPGPGHSQYSSMFLNVFFHPNPEMSTLSKEK